MNEKFKEIFKKFGKRIATIGIGITAVICGIVIRERNNSYRKRAREIEGIVDTAEDCNKSAQDGIEEAIGILQKARKRQAKI